MYRLVCLHEFSAKFGGGLSPTLYDLFVRGRFDRSENIAALNAPQHSAGPAHHAMSSSELEQRGVASLGPLASPDQKGKSQSG